jgi:dTDP-4-dehydrorhamnose 3,5-epimerase
MVMHVMRADAPEFERFGEVYMSVINPGVVKGWKKHLEIVQNYAVGTGAIRLVIYDDRRRSRTFGRMQVIETGRERYAVIRIPPLVWYAAKAISEQPAVICNCTTLEHFDEDILRLPWDSDKIPYRWE